MVDPLFRKDILSLAETQASPCVSFYVPSSPISGEAEAGRLHLKNGVTQAETLLVEGGMRPTLARDLVEPVRELVENHEFWLKQGHGLAVFLMDGKKLVYRLPMTVEPQVTVGTRPNIRPLIPLLETDATFHVLAIGRNDVRLIRCTAYEADEVEVPHMPKDLRHALDEEAPEQASQMHLAGTGAGSVIRHGAGERSDEKDRTIRYCQVIDKAVTKYLHDSGDWLVLAADAPIADAYRSVNHYPHLAKGFVPGSPKVTTPTHLRDEAAALLLPKFGEARQKALEDLAFKAGTGLTSAQPDEIAREASYGRIGTLMLSSGDALWGMRTEDGSLALADGPNGKNEDLLNLAAIDTLRNGGEVFEVPSEMLPSAPAAAIYRR